MTFAACAAIFTIFLNMSPGMAFAHIVIYPKTTKKSFYKLAEILLDHLKSLTRSSKVEIRRIRGKTQTIFVSAKRMREHSIMTLGNYFNHKLGKIRRAVELNLHQSGVFGGSLFSILYHTNK